MPPKLTLQVDTASIRADPAVKGGEQNEVPSIEIGSNGTLKLIKSYQAFEFNNTGMKRNAITSPLATGAATMHQSYQISEKDVIFMETLGKVPVVLFIKHFGQLKQNLCQAKGCVDQNVLAGITERVLQGLSYLHSNHTVHRDIKPANILLSTQGEAKVSDFGISAFVDNTLAQCHTFLGTVTYMSPERIDGQPYSFPADIWALGLTLLECCTGSYPYDASQGTMQLMIQLMEDDCPLPDVGYNVSPALRDFIQRCMHKSPMKRATAVELLRHPFLKQAEGADLKAYMGCMFVENSQIHDAALIITTKFYNNLSYNWSDSDVTASFFDADVRFISRAADGSSQPVMFKGQYTVAAHFHDLVRQIGPKASFRASMKKMRYKEKQGSYLVNIVQRVSIFNSHTSSVNEQSAIGTYEENLVMEITSISRLSPGKSFRFVSQDISWSKPFAQSMGEEDKSPHHPLGNVDSNKINSIEIDCKSERPERSFPRRLRPKDKYQFWETQPVSQFHEDDGEIVEGPIDDPKTVSDVRQDPYSLPSSFEWCDCDVQDEGVLKEIYELLSAHYVEDDDNMFRFAYSRNFAVVSAGTWLPSELDGRSQGVWFWQVGGVHLSHSSGNASA
eukprot:jgi/Picre1/29112/NNA_004505.t1